MGTGIGLGPGVLSSKATGIPVLIALTCFSLCKSKSRSLRHIVARLGDANLVLDEQFHELVAIHERDGNRVRPLCLVASAATESARGDDEPMLVGAQPPTHLLHLQRLDVLSPLPGPEAVTLKKIATLRCYPQQSYSLKADEFLPCILGDTFPTGEPLCQTPQCLGLCLAEEQDLLVGRLP